MATSCQTDSKQQLAERFQSLLLGAALALEKLPTCCSHGTKRAAPGGEGRPSPGQGRRKPARASNGRRISRDCRLYRAAMRGPGAADADGALLRSRCRVSRNASRTDREENPAHCVGSFPLHRWRDVAVEVAQPHGICVSQSLGGNLRRHAACNHRRGAGVAESISRQAGEPGGRLTPARGSWRRLEGGRAPVWAREDVASLFVCGTPSFEAVAVRRRRRHLRLVRPCSVGLRDGAAKACVVA